MHAATNPQDRPNPAHPAHSAERYREELKARRSDALSHFAVRPNAARLLHDLARAVDRTLTHA